MKNTKINEERALQQYIKAMSKDMSNEAEMLLYKKATLLGHIKKIRNLKQPVVLLMRTWGEIETHEGITNPEWPIPPGKNSQDDPPKRVVHLNRQSLYDLKFGGDSTKVYVVNENDAMPVGANPKVWSESLYHKLQSILINIHKLQEQLGVAKMKAIGNMWWYIGGAIAIVIIAFALYKTLVPTAPTPADIPIVKAGIETAGRAISNVTGGFK